MAVKIIQCDDMNKMTIKQKGVEDPDKEIDFRECKHIIHNRSTVDSLTGERTPDVHYVKEKITYKDGTTADQLVIYEDFKRPIWITKDVFRTHKKKKEAEELDKVNEVLVTESNKWYAASYMLKNRNPNPTLVKDSPYLYGIDVKAGVFLKKLYMDRYPDKFTKCTLVCLDIEADVETDTITIITIVREGEIYTSVLKSLVAKYTDVTKLIKETALKHMPDADKFKITINYYDTELELVTKTMEQVHKWSPDFLSIWNMEYDLTMMRNVLERNNIKPENVFSDPEVPPKYRYFYYKKGMEFKVSSSGDKKASDIQSRWNSVFCPAKFYWVDGMVVYNYIRVNTKKVPTGYGLDSILDHEMGDKFKKLKFPHLNDDGYVKVDWHRFMSSKHPIEYIVYNMWDAMSMIYLDNHTRDIKESFPVLSDISMLEDFSSGPVRCLNSMLFFYLNYNKVIGTKAKNIEHRRNLGLKDMIVTLPNRNFRSRLSEGSINDVPELEANVARFVGDLDQLSAYPMDDIVLNSSGDTTMLELISIGDFDKDTIIALNISLFSGKVYNFTYTRSFFNMPTLYELDKEVKLYLESNKDKK